jgi:hypothetical protein
MTPKDDPLGQQHSYRGRTLWLDRDNMLEARENYWNAYQALIPSSGLRLGDDKQTWDISWAAAIAAFAFIQEGRVEPR